MMGTTMSAAVVVVLAAAAAAAAAASRRIAMAKGRLTGRGEVSSATAASSTADRGDALRDQP